MKQIIDKESIHIGCSTYNNGYWKVFFYPEDLPRNKWFEYYCEHFNSYEFNGSFYRTPTVRRLKAWYDKTPPGFLFSVKAPKEITHVKNFSKCKELIEEFYATCRTALQEKLACILFQLPPSYDYSPKKLELIMASLNPDFKNVIEFRNQSWWNDEVFQTLSDHNVTFCTPSYSKLPETVIKTNATGYIRLHGRPKLFYSDYSEAELAHFYDEAVRQDWKEVFVFFNNTASEAGIENATTFKELAGKTEMNYVN